MEAYFLLLTVFGAVVILTAWLPRLLDRLPLSLPMVCIGIGFVLVWTPFSPVTWVNPLENRYLTERLTEFVVIIALMGAGLKLDRPVSWRGWETSWRLVGIAMPLTIAGITLLGWTVLGLGVASALLLGAALSPTDPVLASDIQVGPPHSDNEDEVRFALTSEAGLNDGAAFPFVHLAVALAVSHASGVPFLTEWFLVDVVWKIASGVGIGWLGGKVMAYITFRLLSAPNDGLVALGITCLAYGSTELLHGYGFLSVFITAVAFRSFERKHQYHTRLHEFSEQIERLVMMILLVCFGAAIGEGSIFAGLTWEVVLMALLILFVVRPVSGWLCLANHPAPPSQKAAIAFFGIRGLGSFYYLAYALGQAEFEQAQTLWVTVCFVVISSIFTHGVLATPTMRLVDHQTRRRTFRKSSE